MRKTVGIFGGTFDPIHIGHLRMALEIKQQLGLDEMRLVPCHRPPHRGAPGANSAQRVEMLRLALAQCATLQLDEREVRREQPSYTFDTLSELRAELGPDVSLVLCMGADAFGGLTSWHRWRELTDLAHILVVARPGWHMPHSGEVEELLKQHPQEPEQLGALPFGAIVLHSLRLLPVSATDIRHQVNAGESAQFLLPDAVWQYIVDNSLYR